MKYLCRHPKTLQQLECWAGPKTLVFAKFFFWKPGTELQKSLAGLIRGLLYCLLSNSPGLIPVALPAQWAESRVQVDVYLDRDQILNAFDKVISSSESSRGHKFFFMIDGLDEFTGNHAELVRRLFDWTRKAADVKMCVSSREWAMFQDRFKDCSRIKLHELTRSDIQRVVRDRLREPECAALLQEARCNPDDLEESITDKADGVFLWVSTILRQIEEGIINGDQMSDLEHKIDSLPTDLEYMFQHLFDSIARPDQRIAYLILEVALLVSETEGGRCCLSRYSFLEDYLTDTNFAISLPVKPIDRLLIMERLKRAQRRIYGICKGFLEIVSYSAQGESESLETFASMFGRASGILEAEREANSLFGGAVKFTHRSIVEFLSGHSIRHRMQSVLLEIDTFDAWCQTLLAQVKVISAHQPELCYPDPVPLGCDINEFYNSHGKFSFRACIELQPYGERMFSRMTKLQPAWFSDDLIDISLIMATKLPRNSNRFEHFISHISDTAAQLALSPILIEFVDSNSRRFRSRIRVCADLSAVPYHALIVAGLPLFRTGLAAWRQDILLWMLLGRMEESACFDSHMSTLMAVQNLRLYLEEYNTPNEGSAVKGVPRWHFYLWRCCWGIPVLATIALCLYYGANPWFWIVVQSKDPFVFWFETGPNNFSSEKFDDWMKFRRKELSFISKESSDFWERHKYRLSLGDLLALWFPKYSEGLQKVVDWLGEQEFVEGDLSTEKREELQNTFGHFLRPLFEGSVLEGFHDRDKYWKKHFASGSPEYRYLRSGDRIRYCIIDCK